MDAQTIAFIGTRDEYERIREAVQEIISTPIAEMNLFLYSHKSDDAILKAVLESGARSFILGKSSAASVAPHALDHSKHILLLDINGLSVDEYDAILRPYLKNKYPSRRIACASLQTAIADSKILTLKKLIGAHRLGEISHIFSSVRYSSSDSNDALSRLLIPTFFLLNEQNEEDFLIADVRAAWYQDPSREEYVLMSSAETDSGAHALVLAAPDENEGIEIHVQGTRGSATWGENDYLSIRYEGGIRENYTYVEDAQTLTKKALVNFFNYVSGHSSILFSPLEDARTLFQFLDSTENAKRNMVQTVPLGTLPYHDEQVLTAMRTKGIGFDAMGYPNIHEAKRNPTRRFPV